MATSPRPGQPRLEDAVNEFLKAEQPKVRPSAPTPVRRGPAPVPAPGAATPPEEMPELRAAYSGLLKHEAEKAARVEAPPPFWRKALMPALLGLLVAASAYVWFGHPAFLAPPPHARLEAPKALVSGQRQLVAIALEIDDFRRTTGRLPANLAELGLNAEYISYTALPNLVYELRLGTGPHSVYYRGTPEGDARIQKGEAS